MISIIVLQVKAIIIIHFGVVHAAWTTKSSFNLSVSRNEIKEDKVPNKPCPSEASESTFQDKSMNCTHMGDELRSRLKVLDSKIFTIQVTHVTLVNWIGFCCLYVHHYFYKENTQKRVRFFNAFIMATNYAVA